MRLPFRCDPQPRLHAPFPAILAPALALMLAGGCGAAEDPAPDADAPMPGDGPPTSSKLPSAKAKQVIAGYLHSCALTTEGGVRCWGYHRDGSLGLGDKVTESSPDFNWDRHMASQVVGLTSGVAQITGTSRAGHVCALLDTGRVKCWGENDGGQLGTGKPMEVTPVDIAGVEGATAIAAGGSHVCALVAGGKIKCWGEGQSGQLGNGGETRSTTAVEVVGLEGVTAIAAGGRHTCALKGGAVSCWGRNTAGESGAPDNQPTLTPYAIPSLTSGVRQLALGDGVSCAILQSGGARCWGDNDKAQLAASTAPLTYSYLPLDLGLSAVTALALGASEGAAVVNGKVTRWGTEPLRQGNTRHEAPVPGPQVPGTVAQLAVGNQHMCAMTTDGAVYCWGNNDGGQAGYFDNQDSLHHLDAATPIDSLP